MDEFTRAAGFKGLAAQKRKFSSVVKETSEKSGSRRKLFASDDNRLTECFSYCGRNFGLTTYNSKSNNDIVKIKRWEVFGESKYDIMLNNAYAEKAADGRWYIFCEEYSTGSEFEFRLNNVLEYKKKWKSYSLTDAPCKANVAGMASYGTIILPVVKDETAIEAREQEDREQKELLERARQGDEEADKLLYERAKEIRESVKERLKTEDLLSVFEGYLLPVGNEEGVFAVLGEIMDIESDNNDVTGENVLRLTLDITGAQLSVFVNDSDVTGMPMVGMRFMGVCKLQGSVLF